MKRRKLLENKMASAGIIGTLITLIANILMGAVITVPSETGAFQMGRFAINFDQLPKEIRDTMLSKGFSWYFVQSPEWTIWKREHKYVREKFTDVDHITCQFLDFNLSVPQNSTNPIYIISYILTAKNKLNIPLFYLEVRGTFINTTGDSIIIPYAENRVSSLFRRTWQIHELDRDNTTGMITAEGEFFNQHTQQTITLEAYLYYNVTTMWHNETYKIII